MILDQLDGVPDSIRHGKTGFASFALLLAAGMTAFILAQRADQYCFLPPVHNWAFESIRVCLLAELCGVVIGLFGLSLDKQKLFSILTLGLFLPLLIADALAMGCN